MSEGLPKASHLNHKSPEATIGGQEKESRLRKIRDEIEDWGDRLGEGVDEKIKDTLAILNALDLPTIASCEGHFEEGGLHGYPVPWVEFAVPNKPDVRFEHEQEIYAEVAKKYGIAVEEVRRAHNEQAWIEASRLCNEQPETQEYQVWEEENTFLASSVQVLLDEFYSKRNVPEEVRITVDQGVGGFRIHAGGKFYIPNNEPERMQQELSEEERKELPEILRRTQEEMRTFTEFLRTKYFNA